MLKCHELVLHWSVLVEHRWRLDLYINKNLIIIGSKWPFMDPAKFCISVIMDISICFLLKLFSVGYHSLGFRFVQEKQWKMLSFGLITRPPSNKAFILLSLNSLTFAFNLSLLSNPNSLTCPFKEPVYFLRTWICGWQNLPQKYTQAAKQSDTISSNIYFW